MDKSGCNDDRNLASSLCKTGCGFFGTSQFDGMCSQCYKDVIKRKQAAPTDVGRVSPQTSSASSSTYDPRPAVSPSVETASPTVAVAKTELTEPCQKLEPLSETSTAPSAADNKTRNRCHTCKKKVGLTGFECRCGGLYCGLHRYSDKHSCQFDYKEHGAEMIRKNNPVVVGEKIQKI